MEEALRGEMVMVMTVGDRNDGITGFEFDDAPEPTGSCDNNYWYISDIKIHPGPAQEDNSLIISDEPADNHLDCEVGCTECKKAWYEDSPDKTFGMCTRADRHRFGK